MARVTSTALDIPVKDGGARPCGSGPRHFRRRLIVGATGGLPDRVVSPMGACGMHSGRQAASATRRAVSPMGAWGIHTGKQPPRDSPPDCHGPVRINIRVVPWRAHRADPLLSHGVPGAKRLDACVAAEPCACVGTRTPDDRRTSLHGGRRDRHSAKRSPGQLNEFKKMNGKVSESELKRR